ncbi:MAG TPA: sulfatase-like hydrolase/transferase [Vicinamibacterales bacterium]
MAGSRVVAASAAVCVLALAASCSNPPRTTTRPDIVLVTIDTWRADRLDARVAPALNRLADTGLRFTAARSAVPLTLPSHTTILTGLLPPAHGVRENGTSPLPADKPTVARLLKEHGYATAAFVGAYVLDHRFGLAQGFDMYDDRIPRDPLVTERLEAERRASAVVDRALEWLSAKNPAEGPLFMWIHLYDPHAPYDAPAEFLTTSHANPPLAPYDAEVAYADSQIARVFDALRTRGTMDRTVIVVAGDHGEGLGDHHEATHGMLVYDSTLRVPLIVAAPGIAGSRRDDAVSLIDIAPTVLRAAGVATPADMHGRDLLAKAGDKDNRKDTDRDVYAETMYPRAAGWATLHAVTDGRWKAIRAGATTELYDVQADPHEQRNLATTQQATVQAMRTRIDQLRASSATVSPAMISSEAQERLRALGYVASTAQTSATDEAPNPANAIDDWNAFESALSDLRSRKPDALATLARLSASHPDAAVFQTTYAGELRSAGRAREALAIYRRAATRWPTDATLMHDLAATARDAASDAPNGRALLDEAAKADRAAIALAPDSALAHNGLGLLAADQGRSEEAAREFERAVALDSDNASYWANLGNARRAGGDRAGAEQAFRKAVDLDPKSADGANGLGVLLVEANRPAEAASWFERALASSPTFVEARLNLGIALAQAGSTQPAAAAFRAVLAAPGDHPHEKDAARKLLAGLSAR